MGERGFPRQVLQRLGAEGQLAAFPISSARPAGQDFSFGKIRVFLYSSASHIVNLHMNHLGIMFKCGF